MEQHTCEQAHSLYLCSHITRLEVIQVSSSRKANIKIRTTVNEISKQSDEGHRSHEIVEERKKSIHEIQLSKGERKVYFEGKYEAVICL